MYIKAWKDLKSKNKLYRKFEIFWSRVLSFSFSLSQAFFLFLLASRLFSFQVLPNSEGFINHIIPTYSSSFTLQVYGSNFFEDWFLQAGTDWFLVQFLFLSNAGCEATVQTQEKPLSGSWFLSSSLCFVWCFSKRLVAVLFRSSSHSKSGQTKPNSVFLTEYTGTLRNGCKCSTCRAWTLCSFYLPFLMKKQY